MRPPSDKELRLLLLRLSRKLPERLKLLKPNNPRNIKLGLERIKRAVPQEQTWRGVHVAGTNGKGSICAYLDGLFTLAGKSHGRYTSPAFPEKRHGVTINGKAVRQSMYDHERDCVLRQYEKLLRGFQITSGEKDPGHLTPFEIDTATAFRIFNTLKLPYAIVEVGMGGGTDATNVMKNKGVTVISKIGIDHAEYLGRTLREIASVKAGIMARKVPCIVDHTNEPEVLEVLKRHAWETDAPMILSSEGRHLLSGLDNETFKLEDWQQQNLLCAVTAFTTMFPEVPLDLNKLLRMNPSLPGRLQHINILPTNEGDTPVTALVDGAHNPLATQKLGGYVNRHLRKPGEAVTWVIGFSHSDTKPFKDMLQDILRPQDNVAFVEFTRQESDPPPVPARSGREWAQEYLGQNKQDLVAPTDITLEEALEWAREKSKGGSPIVVTGSLYLIRDLMTLPQVDGGQLEGETRSIGSATFKALRKKKREEGLTGEELLQYLEKKREYSDPRDRARLLRRNAKREQLLATGQSSQKTTLNGVPAIKQMTDIPADQTGEPSSWHRPVMSTVDAEVFLTTSEKDTIADLEELIQRIGSVPKRGLYTPFWRDPDNPSMSLPDPSGKLSQRAKNRMARAKRRLQYVANTTGLDGHEEDEQADFETEAATFAADEQPLVADEIHMIDAAAEALRRCPRRPPNATWSPIDMDETEDQEATIEEALKEETLNGSTQGNSWSSIIESRKIS